MNVTRARKEILEALDDWTPGHFLARRVGRQYHPNVTDDLALLFKDGYVLRDQPNTPTAKHSAWRRTQKADKFLGVELARSTASFEHQVLDNMKTLSTQFGVDDDRSFRLKYWPDMLQSGIVTNIDLLKRIRAGSNPHKLFLNDHPHYFDNNNKGPLWLQHETNDTFIFDELDRDTEQGRSTVLTEQPTNHRQTWTNKIRAMKEFGQKKVWSTWYGCTAHFQRIVTVNDAAKQRILSIIEQEFTGKCKFIGVATWRDWGNHRLEHKGGERKYPPADGWAFTTPYERVGYEPYYLNKFHLMDR